MSFTYAEQKKKISQKNCAEPFGSSGEESYFPNSAQLENLGHQVDMPVVMREKMEGAFGMDLSSVKLYENKAVGDAGAEAVAQGSKIAFAPGKLDFSSIRGQALLGHEISHVASQARGEVNGSGFLNDSALEARADREGMMAAHGESVSAGYGGASAPLSNASAASAAGPMQAKSGRKKRQERLRAEMESANYYSTREADEDEELDGPIAPENNPVRPEPKKEEAGNNLVANIRTMINKQQSEIDLDKGTKLRRRIRRINQNEKLKKLKKQKNWQNKINEKTKLNMGEIKEADEEYVEDLNEPLITTENVPEINENKPAEEKSKLALFMQNNNFGQHPAQDQVLAFLNGLMKKKK